MTAPAPIRVEVSFSDGCRPLIETWPDASIHRHMADRFARAMTSKVALPYVSVWCADCKRWENADDAYCSDCGEPACVLAMAANYEVRREAICDECRDERNAAPRDCLCPGPAELGMCHCPNCAGRACA